MKALRYLVIGLFLSHDAAARSADFAVEDESLGSVPEKVAAAIAASSQFPIVGTDEQPCRFVGKTASLHEKATSTDWLVTTADACSWAASAAPIWVVSYEPDGFKVVLRFVTYEITIGTSTQNGMRNIATDRATASLVEEQLWKFDGQAYRLSKNKTRPLQ